MQPADSLRLLGTAKLLFETGRAVLVKLASKQRSEPDSAWQSLLLAEAAVQLIVFNRLMDETVQTAPDNELEAAFARTTAKPTALLPWVLAVTEALQLACSGPDTDAGELWATGARRSLFGVPCIWVSRSYSCLAALTIAGTLHLPPAAGRLYPAVSCYLRVLNLLLNHCWWELHRSELLGQPEQKQLIVHCVLQQALPALAAQLETVTASGVNWEAVQPIAPSKVSPIYFGTPGAPRPSRRSVVGQDEAWLGGLLHTEHTRPFTHL